MIFDRLATLLARTESSDGAGGTQEAWAPVMVGETETAVTYPCRLLSRSGIALRRPLGIDPGWEHMAVGPVPDADVHAFQARDRLLIDGETWEVLRAEIARGHGPHHQRLMLKRV